MDSFFYKSITGKEKSQPLSLPAHTCHDNTSLHAFPYTISQPTCKGFGGRNTCIQIIALTFIIVVRLRGKLPNCSDLQCLHWQSKV